MDKHLLVAGGVAVLVVGAAFTLSRSPAIQQQISNAGTPLLLGGGGGLSSGSAPASIVYNQADYLANAQLSINQKQADNKTAFELSTLSNLADNLFASTNQPGNANGGISSNTLTSSVKDNTSNAIITVTASLKKVLPKFTPIVAPVEVSAPQNVSFIKMNNTNTYNTVTNYTSTITQNYGNKGGGGGGWLGIIMTVAQAFL